MPVAKVKKAKAVKKAKLLVRENIVGRRALFMMNSDDFRLTDPRFFYDYEILATGRFADGKLITKRGTFQVFEDWSVKLVSRWETK